MSDRGDIKFLSDILSAISRINSYIDKLHYEEFIKDTKTQDAVIRNLEAIGEATKKISNDVKSKHPLIPWRNLAGVRDKLIHHYFGVNFDIVWNIIKEELPSIVIQIKDIITQVEKEV